MVKLLETTVIELKNIVKLLQAGGRSEEAVWVFNKEGFECRILDPSHVAMVGMTIPPAGFGKYEAKQEYSLGIDMKKLNNILKILRSDMALSLEYMTKDRTLRVKSGSTEVTLGLLNTIAEVQRKPQIDLDAHFTVTADDFSHALSAAALVSELAEIEVTSKVIVSSNSEKDNITTEVATAALTGEGNGKYDMEYLSSTIKAIAGAIDAHLSTDKPLLLDFKIGDHGSGFYFLAPRVEDDA